MTVLVVAILASLLAPTEILANVQVGYSKINLTLK